MTGIAVVAALLGCGAASAGPGLTVIHAGRLIDGQGGNVLNRMSIVIRDDRIEALESGFLTPAGATIIDLSGATVLPGLIDSHSHLTAPTRRPDAGGAALTQTTLDHVLAAVPNAAATLLAGFTSVRDVGGRDGADLALKKAIARSDIIGPRMWVALESLGPTGGHSDLSNGLDPALSNPRWQDSVVDGVEAVVWQVREHKKRGADLIKIMPSGGVTSIGDDPKLQLMSDDEIRAAIETAHALGLKVTANALGKSAIESSVRLGIDAIEHGTLADQGTHRQHKERGVNLIPTLLVASMMMNAVRQTPERFGPTVVQKTLRQGPMSQASFMNAYRRGVKIAFGTDVLWDQGSRARQLVIMVDAGMSPMDAIASAPMHAAELLWATADVGSIAAARYADIIAVIGDPLTNIAVLQDVRFVMKGGVVYKAWGDR